MRGKDAVGVFGEDVAARHLSSAGLQILERNWRCRDGEIDIIARDADTIVFCEVKTRSGDAFGAPAEALTPAKRRRIRLLAVRWLAQALPRGVSAIRFDVLAVRRQPGCDPEVEHLRGAF